MAVVEMVPREPQADYAIATSALQHNSSAATQDENTPADPEVGSTYTGVADDLPEHPPSYDLEYDHRKPWTRYPMGYPRFAAFIANDEDRSTTIFRRFQRLSARNLLYLESELAYLEAEQDRLDQESRKSHNSL
jgi:hypothetical protein